MKAKNNVPPHTPTPLIYKQEVKRNELELDKGSLPSQVPPVRHRSMVQERQAREATR